jgi:hypothetical protein
MRFLLQRDPAQGQIIKMEKMLIRVDVARAPNLPDDFDENYNQGDIGTTKKWREYMVVCRQTGEDLFALQMYKTRVIPALDQADAKGKKPTYTVELGAGSSSKVNLYSALDKTLVIYSPQRRASAIFILQARSSSVEWLTFLRQVSGTNRTDELKILVPELDIALQIDDPFNIINAKGNGNSELDEEAVAPAIVKRCLIMLEDSKEWGEVVSESEKRGEKYGLAWKRYDRLEWIHGPNEKNMFGTISMLQSHVRIPRDVIALLTAY